MASNASPRFSTGGRASGSENVEEFLAALDHPRKGEILALRAIILAAHPSIVEGIKWNSLSFRTSEYFATFHLRAKQGVQIILHLGAKKRDRAVVALDDPESMLTWLDDARASVTFIDGEDIQRHRPAFTEIIRHWIEHV